MSDMYGQNAETWPIDTAIVYETTNAAKLKINVHNGMIHTLDRPILASVISVASASTENKNVII